MQDKWQEKIYLICVWASGITTCHQIAQFPIWKLITCNLSVKPQITNSPQTSKVGLKLQCFGFGCKCADHWATLLQLWLIFNVFALKTLHLQTNYWYLCLWRKLINVGVGHRGRTKKNSVTDLLKNEKNLHYTRVKIGQVCAYKYVQCVIVYSVL